MQRLCDWFPCLLFALPLNLNIIANKNQLQHVRSILLAFTCDDESKSFSARSFSEKFLSLLALRKSNGHLTPKIVEIVTVPKLAIDEQLIF